MIDFPPKEPGETADFLFDFTAALQDGEVIATADVSVANVTLDSAAIVDVGAVEDAGVRVWLSAGTEGSVARVTATVVTDSVPPRTFVETAVLPIGGGPVGLAAVKAHLRVDFDDEDALIRSYLRGAVSAVEKLTGRALSPRVEEFRLKAFPSAALGTGPASNRIVLPRDPVQEVVLFTYLDSGGATVELVEEDGEFRTVAGEPYLLFPESGGSWPPALDEEGAVRVRALVGYEAGQVPPELISAVLLLTGHFYLNREAVVTGTISTELPLGVQALCFPFRRNLIG